MKAKSNFLLSLFSFIALSSIAKANEQIAPLQSFVNSIAVDVGSNPDDEVSYPLVMVTLCAPGTSTCQSIPNVFLDTGSTGLRIKTNAIEPELMNALPILKDESGKEIAECFQYADTDDWWGRVGTADVKFGTDTASGISVQLVDPSYGHHPLDCGGKVSGVAKEKINGVLGIYFTQSDCYDHECVGGAKNLDHYGMAYYACGEHGFCKPHSMPVPLQVSNPVYALGLDSNGYILQMPAIDPNGSPDSRGSLVFGINTRENNQLDPAASVIALNPSDNTFPVTMSGLSLNGFLDSGTGAYAIPAKKLGIPECKKKDAPGYLCPTSPQDFTVKFQDFQGKNESFKIDITSGKDQLASSNYAFDRLAIDSVANYSDALFLGLPFFFGKKIYFGFASASAPLGAGKRVAILPEN